MRTFFDMEDRLERLTKIGDSLVKLNEVVDWDLFRQRLEEIFYVEDTRDGGRRHYDRVLMFKILILQNLYNISDDNTEYQINDRLSFQRFLGLDIGDRVPDAKTIWAYREHLSKSGQYKELFELYLRQLEKAGLVTKRGSIVDATFVERPRQNNGGKGQESETEKANRERQTDKDAAYAIKNKKRYFGFKNHIKVDTDSKLITGYTVTPANRHDGKEAPNVLDATDENVYLDSCYRGKEMEAAIQQAAPNAKIHIVRKHDGYHEPTAEQLKGNAVIQRIRQRVEHVFGYMVKSMGGKNIRSCGLPRAEVHVTLKNLAYNMRRVCILMG